MVGCCKAQPLILLLFQIEEKVLKTFFGSLIITGNFVFHLLLNCFQRYFAQCIVSSVIFPLPDTNYIQESCPSLHGVVPMYFMWKVWETPLTHLLDRVKPKSFRLIISLPFYNCLLSLHLCLCVALHSIVANVT